MSPTGKIVFLLLIITVIASIPIVSNVVKDLSILPERTPINIPTAIRNVDQTQASSAANIQTRKIQHVYLVALADNGRFGTKIGCSDSLIPYPIVSSVSLSLDQKIRLLVQAKQQYYQNTKLYNSFYQSDLTVQEIKYSGNTTQVYLSGNLKIAGVCDTPRIYEQLHATIQEENAAKSIEIYINGERL